MGANLDVSSLRLFLGEQSAAIWSDNDLRTYLALANLTIWKILSDQAPDLTSYTYPIKIGPSGGYSAVTFTTPIRITTIEGETIDASTEGIGAKVSGIRAVYETSSPVAANPSYKKLKVKTSHGHYPVLENSNSILADMELPNIYQDRVAIFDYGSQSLTIWPTLKKEMTYQVDLTTDGPLYIKSGATTTRTNFITEAYTDDSEFLGTERFWGNDGNTVAVYCHQLVLYEAAYQASFVDKAMRREFAGERDRLLALMATPGNTGLDEAY